MYQRKLTKQSRSFRFYALNLLIKIEESNPSKLSDDARIFGNKVMEIINKTYRRKKTFRKDVECLINLVKFKRRLFSDVERYDIIERLTSYYNMQANVTLRTTYEERLNNKRFTAVLNEYVESDLKYKYFN